jgi:hypothetical protein
MKSLLIAVGVLVLGIGLYNSPWYILVIGFVAVVGTVIQIRWDDNRFLRDPWMTPQRLPTTEDNIFIDNWSEEG